MCSILRQYSNPQSDLLGKVSLVARLRRSERKYLEPVPWNTHVRVAA